MKIGELYTQTFLPIHDISENDMKTLYALLCRTTGDWMEMTVSWLELEAALMGQDYLDGRFSVEFGKIIDKTFDDEGIDYYVFLMEETYA